LDAVRIDTVEDLNYQLEIRKPGDEANFTVGRVALVEEIPVTLEKFPVPIYKIVDVGSPTDEQLKTRKKWFKQ
jgi:hypothetical protein